MASKRMKDNTNLPNKRKMRGKVYSEFSTLGFTFLEEHKKMQEDNGIDEKHVIVDREDYNMVLQYLTKNNITAQTIINSSKENPFLNQTISR